MRLAHVALVVRDYDEAIAWFTTKLGFELIADDYIAEQDKRWVLIRPPGRERDASAVLLARAANADQARTIGNQCAGRVFLFLHTDDFERDYERMRSQGVTFVRPPQAQSYGTVAVFEDLYGNRWDLIQPASPRA